MVEPHPEHPNPTAARLVARCPFCNRQVRGTKGQLDRLRESGRCKFDPPAPSSVCTPTEPSQSPESVEDARLDNHYGYCTLPPDHDGPCGPEEDDRG